MNKKRLKTKKLIMKQKMLKQRKWLNHTIKLIYSYLKKIYSNKFYDNQIFPKLLKFIYQMIFFEGININIHFTKICFFYWSSLTLSWQPFEYTIEQFSIKQRNNDRILTSQFRLDYYQYWTLTIYPVNFLFIFFFK
jgi:hypothetical protein